MRGGFERIDDHETAGNEAVLHVLRQKQHAAGLRGRVDDQGLPKLQGLGFGRPAGRSSSGWHFAGALPMERLREQKRLD